MGGAAGGFPKLPSPISPECGLSNGFNVTGDIYIGIYFYTEDINPSLDKSFAIKNCYNCSNQPGITR